MIYLYIAYTEIGITITSYTYSVATTFLSGDEYLFLDSIAKLIFLLVFAQSACKAC